jgi:PKHD-type hydroxylase
MHLHIVDLLSPETLADLRQSLAVESDSFTSGKATAGWQARAVKHNDQSTGSSAQRAMEIVRVALMAHPIFTAAARPVEIHKMLVSRYRPGMAYGTHVDDALMGGKRTDLSFTVFLNDPGDYDGGELVLEGNDGDEDIKLPAGTAFVYPTTALHHVAEVTRGERLVVVGWVKSFIRDAAKREMLFDLDQTIAALKATNADRQVMNLVSKTRNNLIRMWAED